jgi:predicted acyltransferase (DUF342 family)
MFSKGEKAMAQPSVKTNGAPSIISSNLHIVGDLNTNGEIQIDGTVDGDVKGNSLTVGTQATVNGEIFADSVVVRGSVNGRIKADTVRAPFWKATASAGARSRKRAAPARPRPPRSQRPRPPARRRWRRL